jgi:hypothetical protein
MGYRSDITIVMYPDPLAPERWGAVKLWVQENMVFDGLNLHINDDAALAEITAEQWKWYDDYEDVQAIERALSRFLETFPDGTVAWEFIRIGEDYDDTELRKGGNSHCRLNLSRTVVID